LIVKGQKQTIFYLSVVMFLSMGGCSKEVAQNDTSSRATLLIIDPESAKIFQRNGALLKYIDDFGLPRLIQLTASKNSLVINADRHFIQMAYQDEYLPTQYFIVQGGDSVEFSYGETSFVTKTINRRSPRFDENYNTQRNAILHGDRLSNTDDFNRMSRLMNSKAIGLSHDEELTSELTKLRERGLQDLTKESAFIDSLLVSGLVSKEIAGFYQLRVRFDSLKLASQIGSQLIVSNATKPYYLWSSQNLPSGLAPPYLTIYDDWLDQFYQQLTSSEKRLTVGRFNHIYDSLKSGWLSDSLAKHSLLLKIVTNFCQNASVSEAKEAISRFNADARDVKMIRHLEQKFASSTLGEDFSLIGSDGKRTTFQQVLSENQSQPVYVDFWATRCLPCLSAFSRLDSLRQGTDIIILYISIDQNETHWQNAVAHYNLQTPFSFRVEDLANLQQIKGLELQSIPRYMLFDKDGTLAHKNAPGPSQIQLLELID
jgi:thiol-disulfide isomerase/thioredoxin